MPPDPNFTTQPTARGMRLADLAARVGATLDGDGSTVVHRVASLEHAGPDAITFLTRVRMRDLLASTRAAAVIVSPADAADTALPKLVHRNPYAIYARVAALLHPSPPVVAQVHATACIGPDAIVDPTADIGPFVAIGARVRVGARAIVGAGCTLADDVEIGDDAHLFAQVSVYERCTIGARTIVHSGVVIGADGFGMAEDDGVWLKIPQIARVVIGADCEIGANTTIDRGALEDTVIEDDVKLDNQIQIGHNCRIGAHTAVAGCVGIAGSTIIGRNCRIGGAAMIAGHLQIVDGCTISAGTLVAKPITHPGAYAGTFPLMPHRDWRYVASGLRRLRTLADRVAALEKALATREDDRGSAP
jgi:UDP-3-O-[3-hydroxymyristoyl] glucosamine N-acyltransferase